MENVTLLITQEGDAGLRRLARLARLSTKQAFLIYPEAHYPKGNLMTYVPACKIVDAQEGDFVVWGQYRLRVHNMPEVNIDTMEGKVYVTAALQVTHPEYAAASNMWNFLRLRFPINPPKKQAAKQRRR